MFNYMYKASLKLKTLSIKSLARFQCKTYKKHLIFIYIKLIGETDFVGGMGWVAVGANARIATPK